MKGLREHECSSPESEIGSFGKVRMGVVYYNQHLGALVEIVIVSVFCGKYFGHNPKLDQSVNKKLF